MLSCKFKRSKQTVTLWLQNYAFQLGHVNSTHLTSGR